MLRSLIAVAVSAFLLSGYLIPAQAKDYYVDGNGSDTGNGSKSAPYKSLSSALSRPGLVSGDKVILRAGEYGALKIGGANFSGQLDVLAAPGEAVHFQSISINNSTNLRLSGFQVWPSNPVASDGSLVQTSGNSTSITFDALDIRSHKDARQYRSWSLAMWAAVKRRGVLLRGSRNSIINSHVTGTFIGISANGEFALIKGNRVSGFSGDALRALGDFSLVTGNYVEDCIKINRNHDDGFQSWSRGPNGKTGKGTVRGLTIENNIILEWNGTAPHPLRCSLQGIGLFDGMFESLTIQNNLVSVSAYHGISVAGGVDSRIINNTVINATGTSDRQPWISVAHHKNGTAPQRVVVANNAAMAFRLEPNIAQTASANYTINKATDVLIDPFGNDFRPRAGGALATGGDGNFAPELDIVGVKRQANGAPAIGAFEGR